MSEAIHTVGPQLLSSIAPVSVRLAQHLQSKAPINFSAAWMQLLRMLPSETQTSSAVFHSCHDCVHEGLTMQIQEIEAYFAAQYSIAMTSHDAEDILHSTARLPIQFVQWNVRGLQGSMGAVQHIIQSIRPMALILTETHLLSRQLSAPWLQCLLQDYDVHATCFPDRNPLASGRHSTPQAVRMPSQNRAGVMIATCKAYIRHQHVSTHTVPSSLKGCLQHISIHSPHSHSLHIVGAYCPPQSGQDSSTIQAQIFDYIAHLQPRLTSSGCKLLLAGDLNAVLHTTHRSSGRLIPMDTKFQELLQACNMQSCYTADPCILPHTCRSTTGMGQSSSSRIDHFLTSTSNALQSDVVHNVLYDAIYDSSDHSPLLLRLQDFKALLCSGDVADVPEQLPGSEQVSFASFPAAAIKQWQANFMSEQTPAIHSAMHAVSEALSCAKGDVSEHVYNDIAHRIDALIISSVQCAQHCFPMHDSPPGTTASTGHVKEQHRYLPRAAAKHFGTLIHTSKACRLACKRAFQCRQQSMPLADCIADDHLQATLSPYAGLTQDVCMQPTYDALHACLQAHRATAQKAMKEIMTRHRNHLQHKQRCKWQKLWYSKRKRAYASVFSQMRDERGSAPTKIAAVQHPIYGTSAQPAIATQALHFHRAHLSSPAVPVHDGPFPWEVPADDSFNLQPAATRQPLLPQLTREVYDTCLTRLKNGKSPGLDSMPNELLKHFPSEMHALLFNFFRLSWRQSRTPHSWKHSITLLFYKKNDPTDPSNYRPIALLKTVYKFWTRIIAAVLSSFCEQHSVLSEPQEGFRKLKSSSRQLQYLKLMLEDAKMHKRDLNICLLDLKSAFDTVDHNRLFAVLQALGIPDDTVCLVKDLHSNATTAISTNHGRTPPISLRRGTIQGDSLSPLLFILFLEPLLRWLSVNDRGYRCASTLTTAPHYACSLAAADDIALLANNTIQMQRQLDKVQAFTDWSGMQLAPSKCETSAVLWGTHASNRSSATCWSTIQPMLQQLRVCGVPIKCIPPDQPFRYLGPLFTLTMDWKPNMTMLLEMIANKGLAIACSPGTIQQKLEMERCCTVGTLAYHFAIAPFSLAQIRALDVARAKVVKRILKLPNSAPSDMLYLPQSRFGCGIVSLSPLYAQVCADTLVASLNDMGRLGIVARAVLQAQMSRKQVTSIQDAPPSWVSSNSQMQLRKASVLSHHNMQVRFLCGWDPELATIDLYELCTQTVAAKGLSAPLPQLQDHVIRPLWQAFGYTCQPFMSGSHMLSLLALHAKHPSLMISLPVQRAYTLLLQICCTATCRLQDMLASPGLAPEPPQYRLFKGSTASSHLALPLRCPADLPNILELSHIVQFVPSAQSGAVGGCYYRVAWCSGPRPSAPRMRRLQAFGIVPHGDMHSLHVSWQVSVLHWSVLAAFWPSKLAAFEARQLQRVMLHLLPATHGIDAQDSYHMAQMQAQHIGSSNIIPAYPVPSNGIAFQFTEANPDRDVRSTGSCILARNSAQVAVYDSAGAWVVNLSEACVSWLARRATLNAMRTSTFATMIRSVMHVPIHDMKGALALDLFKQQFSLPGPLMDSLQTLFDIKYEWFASPVNLYANIPMYASKSACDHMFSSIGDAYSFKWLHFGFANPGLTQAQALAAARWAIASCYEPTPVCNLLVVPKAPRTSALQATLAHAYVQRLLTIPAGACQFSVPSFMHAHCLKQDCLPTPAIAIYLITNQLGMSHFMARHSDTYIGILTQALQASSASTFTLHPLLATLSAPHVLPFKLPCRWQHACSPPSSNSNSGDLFAQALAEICATPPALQWDAASIVYTDGSKRGTSITAAWVHPASGSSNVVMLPGPLQAQSTALRGELAAIYEAVHSSSFPLYRQLTLMTDSQTALYLIHAYIRTPTLLRFHKHRWLVAAIAQNLLSRTAPVRMLKVRAHIGVQGNEAADHLAAEAHDMHDTPVSSFTDPQDRQPAWVQHWFGDTLSDLDTLRKHALHCAELSYEHAVVQRAQSNQSKALQKVLAAEGRDGGMHIASSNAFWAASRITDRQRSLAMQIRFNILTTRYRVALWYPSRNLPESCPLCQAPKDTIGHRLGSCTHPPVKRQICARHGHAVQALASEIRAGMLARCAMLVDAECHQRYVSFPAAFLPLELQTSRPDIILVENAQCEFTSLPTHFRRDPRLTVHIVEVGYTSDFLLHERRSTKLEQHSQLRRNLLDFGWVNVRMHAFVVGHTGVMLASNADVMTALGISPICVGPFLTNLALTSLQKSCAILSCFPSLQPMPAAPVAMPPAPLLATDFALPSAPLAMQPLPASTCPLMSSSILASPPLDTQPPMLLDTPLTASSPDLLSTPLVSQHPTPGDQHLPFALHQSQPRHPLVSPPPIMHSPRQSPRKRPRNSHPPSQISTSTSDSNCMQASSLHPGSELPRRRIRRRGGEANVTTTPAPTDSTHDIASVASHASFTFDPGG